MTWVQSLHGHWQETFSHLPSSGLGALLDFPGLEEFKWFCTFDRSLQEMNCVPLTHFFFSFLFFLGL